MLFYLPASSPQQGEESSWLVLVSKPGAEAQPSVPAVVVGVGDPVLPLEEGPGYLQVVAHPLLHHDISLRMSVGHGSADGSTVGLATGVHVPHGLILILGGVKPHPCMSMSFHHASNGHVLILFKFKLNLELKMMAVNMAIELLLIFADT